jgi:hypothetical protein
MFRLATAPTFANLRRPHLEALPAVKSTAVAASERSTGATANIRIRRFGDSTVTEDTYSAIVPGERMSPADLLNAISDAFKDLPEFQVRDETDERYIISLTLNG